MKTTLNAAGFCCFLLISILFVGCEKNPSEEKLSNTLGKLETLSLPCKGECCSFSQGYWFAKPNVVWPYNLSIGGKTYTKSEGQAIWDAV
jgi:hypothetical protein